jgi:iron complex transport system ATP-binding protein
MNALHIEQFSGGPGKIDVLHNISLKIGPGLTGLVGPNGAGKTTLLRACMGLIEPHFGKITIGAQPITALGLQERARRIAYLAQNGPVHWPMRVLDLVRLGRFASASGPKADAQAVERAMQWCALEGFAERTINTLSGGERSRVLLARALAAQTPVLLIDEPTSALDPAQQHRIMGILRERAQAGTCVVCALHDLPLAARYCDRLVFLHQGRVLEDAKPKHVLTAKSFTKTYGLAFDERGYLRDEPA